MTNFATQISSAAMLALAVLPMAALATAAHAETRVKVVDIDLLTPQGVATFNQRADAAARRYCVSERTLDSRASCLTGVKVELTEKMTTLRTAQLERVSHNLAAR